VLEETGIQPRSYRTLRRRLPVFATGQWRTGLAAACARLYFETDAGDGFREPGFSGERRLDPQITIGLLTDAAGFPLMVHAFEGSKAETSTILIPDGTCSPSRGRAGSRTRAATRSSPAGTGLSKPGAPCAASASKSAKAGKAVAGETPVKRDRFIQLSGGTRTVNRTWLRATVDRSGDRV